MTPGDADNDVAPNDAAAAAAAAATAAASAAEAAALAAQAAAAAVAVLPAGATSLTSVVPSTAKGRSEKVSETFQDFIQSTWVKRLAVWIPTLALCALMRPFYPILLGTYVLTLIGKQV
jgi:cobalamin synthase